MELKRGKGTAGRRMKNPAEGRLGKMNETPVCESVPGSDTIGFMNRALPAGNCLG